jgi:hypothetical protein
MQLKEIDKSRYSKRVKLVFTAIVAALLVLTLAFSTLFIQLFSTPEASHFWQNLAGVAVAAFVVVWALNRLRGHPYLNEVTYVWDLKQMLNRIYRKQKKIEAAAQHGDKNALLIMNFQLRGSKQLFQLDDNTITLENLIPKLLENERRMQAAGLDVSLDSFDPALLEQF